MGRSIIEVKKDHVAVFCNTTGVFLTDPKGMSPIDMATLFFRDSYYFRAAFNHPGKKMTQMDAVAYVKQAVSVQHYRQYHMNPFTSHRLESEGEEELWQERYAEQKKLIKKRNWK